jgi:hypothetical protein
LVGSIVIAGAAPYFCVFTVVLGLLGHPAFTATVLAAAWAAELADEVVLVGVVLVVVVDEVDAALAGFFLLFPETRATMPMMTAAATTTMMTLRVVLRRLSCLACAARRASRPAR